MIGGISVNVLIAATPVHVNHQLYNNKYQVEMCKRLQSDNHLKRIWFRQVHCRLNDVNSIDYNRWEIR